MRNRIAGVLLISALAFASMGCATVKPPANLKPMGQIAWYGVKIVDGCVVIGDVAITAHESGVIASQDETNKIVSAAKVCTDSGANLGRALKAGASQETAKQQAIAAIKSALGNLPGQLSPEVAKLIEPYRQVVITLLSVFGAF